MTVLGLTLTVLFWCFGYLRAVEPPICQDSDIFTAQTDHEWHVRCPPTEACNLELVKYKITKDPQAMDNEWKFDETSTCYLCAPACCHSVNGTALLFKSWFSDVCDQYLLNYGFHAKDSNVWSRYDNEELTYVVLKEQTKHYVSLRLPGQRICSFIVIGHRYVKKLCVGEGYVQAEAVRGERCPQGVVFNGGMCSQPTKVGR